MEDDDLDLVEELPTGGLDVDIDSDSDDEGDEYAGRRGKKRERYDLLLQEREQQRKEAQEREERMRQQLEQQGRQLQELQQFAQQYQDDEDPFEERLDALDTERAQIQKEWAGLTPEAQREQLETFSQRLRRLDQARADVTVDRALTRRQQQQPRTDPQLEYQRAALQTEYGDVFKSQNALRYADAYWSQQVALGRSDDIELKREAFQVARDQFKTSTKSGQRPTATQRALYAGEGRGAAGPGAGENPGRVRLSKEERAMADVRFADLPEQQRYRKFAQMKAKRNARSS